MDESEEATLVRRCQTGDTEAFRELMGLYKNTLFGVAYLMTQDRSSAEDAVQEGLVKIWKYLPTLRQTARVKPWLVRIVANEVKQQFRIKRIRTAPLETVFDIPGGLNLPEEEVIDAERRNYLWQALGTLPGEQREAIVLRFYSGLTVPEIAMVTNRPQGTVKSRLNRALTSLNKRLHHDGFEDGKM